jgi:Arm DNA-binding domain
MARQLKRLTTRTVAGLTTVGRHADGQNLYLTISKTTDGLSKRWTFLYAINGRQREAGLGSASTVSLRDAREKAAEHRSMLSKGI